MKSDLSPKAQAVIAILDDKQRRILNKYYPIKEDRNKAIRELQERGVSTSIVSEITGLSIATIYRIIKERPQEEYTAVTQVFIDLERVIDLLVSVFSDIKKKLIKARKTYNILG